MPNVVALMVMLARESRGFTQTALAKLTGIAQGTISKIENGQLQPNEEILCQLALALGYPQGFFLQEHDFRNLPVDFFRKRLSVSGLVIKAIRARINILRLHVRTLLRSAELPPLRIRPMTLKEFGGDAELAARTIRIQWHLPPGPIENIVKIIEDAGILIVRCDFGTHQIDAVSLYDPDDELPPVILLNSTMPGDRCRFTLAHELMHLIFHYHMPLIGADVDVEGEADRFAAAFLMPRADIRAHLVRPTLKKLASLKPYWKVSIQALLRRADSLGYLTPRQTRFLWMQIGKHGYRTAEPFPIPQEEPTLLKELVRFHIEELGYTEREMSNLLHCEPIEFRATFMGSCPNLRILKRPTVTAERA